VTPIRIAETHISWVLLTGAYAYKIKKPVHLSFLDYSTLDRRQAFCAEEVRLNRRYSPGLYLGVASIRGTVEAPRVEGVGPVLEYAVRMRQFDSRDELAALLASRSVATTELAALGAHIAEFQAAAARVDPASPHGRSESAHRITLDNFAELRRLPEADAWRNEIAMLEQRIALLHEDVGDRMQQRREAGWVRECHGDLHCGNVVRWDGALTPFDGIEFDPGLRFIDVVNDLAFLTMDLSVHERDDLRHAVLQSWAETLGDFGGVTLLPYFEAYRALVRAKVAALRALQEPQGGRARRLDCRSAAHYLDWAAARAHRGRPGLVITCGLSGSGKTWLAQALAGRLLALHVRSDVERKRLAGLRPLEDSRSPPDAGIYTRDFTARTYDRLYDCAEGILRGGESVLVDAAYLRRDERLHMLSLARTLAVPAAVLHCTAPTAVLRERVRHRAAAGSDASEAGLAILERQPSFWEDFSADERACVIDVDTTAPAAVAASLARLAALGIG
jgi:aminoglycoside phosphotransferase family enzyme/predicted kinase